MKRAWQAAVVWLVQRIIIRMVKVKVMLSMPKRRRGENVYCDEEWSTWKCGCGGRLARLKEVAVLSVITEAPG